MPRRTYPSHFSGVVPGAIDSTTMLAIGRLVRACAELDDIVLLHLCVVLGWPEAEVRFQFPGTTDRLSAAKTAAKELGMAFVFGNESRLREALECRNTVAHGVFLGTDDDGRLVFLMDRFSPSTLAQEVRSYAPADVLQITDQAEWLVAFYETNMLGVAEQRAARNKVVLKPHPKAQKR